MIDRLINAAEWALLKLLMWRAKRARILDDTFIHFAKREATGVYLRVLSSAEYHRHEVSEQTARLTKRYDLGMALNESANRAMDDKKVQREAPRLSANQEAALKFQKEYLQKIVDRN